MELTKEEIAELKESLSERELIDEETLEEMRSLKKQSINNPIAFAKLYAYAYEGLMFNYNEFKTDNQDYSKKLLKYLQTFNYMEICRLLEKEFDYREGFGDTIINNKIRLHINKHKQEYKTLIEFFFNLFGVEE